MPAPSVAVTIVTYNSGRFIRRCLEFLAEQDYPRVEIIVVDNASRDDTPQILREYEQRVRIIRNAKNVGFAAAQNQAIALTNAEWILTLNPDVRVSSKFIGGLVAAGIADPTVGSVCGKLLAMSPDFEMYREPLLDSTGLYFTANLRHLDRGSRVPDTGQYEQFEYVFGATGAAALYRRQMIDDISIFNEFFDSDFFSYREDADVAWRAQLLGWKCLYTPRAVAYHVRKVLPSKRRSLPAAINMHSVKNRWLMRIKNVTPGVYRRNFFSITLRDCVVIASCLLGEFTSLRAFPLVIGMWPRMLRKRREIMARRRVSDEYLAHWFSSTPVSYPATLPLNEPALLG